jgi:hypothetical protein
MLGLVGVTSMETNSASVMVRSLVPETPPSVAVIVVTPTPRPVATLPETDATSVSDELQMTLVVRSWCVLSLRIPVAVKP